VHQILRIQNAKSMFCLQKKNKEGIASFEVTKQRLASWNKCIDGLNVGHRICEGRLRKHHCRSKITYLKLDLLLNDY